MKYGIGAMNRREFLEAGGRLILASAFSEGIPLGATPGRPLQAGGLDTAINPNWADTRYHAKALTSSYVHDPPWGYLPDNVFGSNMHLGWEALQQTSGAWLEIKFPEPHPVSEIWILPMPLDYHIVGEEPYMLAHSRANLLEAPRKVTISVPGEQSVIRELPQSFNYQIIALARSVETLFVRIAIEDAWRRPGGEETGVAKLRIYARRHDPTFEIAAYSMYDIRGGRLMQSAGLQLINPGDEVRDARFTVSGQSGELMEIPLPPIPARSASCQEIWIPSPLADTAMSFMIRAAHTAFGKPCKSQVPAYRSYFDGGIFALNCTCHNDLGWLDTPEKTADYRSEEIILPALKLLAEYPEFRYSMESTAYLMEFMERHPEKRDEMFKYMLERRFAWGASYVQCLEVHVGPEKLVRQFYFGGRWLKETFPGVDTHLYVKADPPEMTLQMPQILKKAGVKYIMQGRMPHGFYNWEAPDGSIVLVYAYRYANSTRILDPQGHQGWLQFAQDDAAYYAAHDLPLMYIYDYLSDYLPPQPALPPYVRQQNETMERFADVWNGQLPARSGRQIHPPRLEFVELEGYLDRLTHNSLNIPTLRGDWPFSWAYYDEPGHREGILMGRQAHNELLTAERLLAGMGMADGFSDYPEATFTEAWKANCWPDHGWGGNRGVITDSEYVSSYAKSKRMAEKLLGDAGAKATAKVSRGSSNQIPIVVFNPLSWPRTDLVEFDATPPQDWEGFSIRDEAGREIPFESGTNSDHERTVKLAFIAREVPSVGYRTFYLEQSASHGSASVPLSGEKVENEFFNLTFGAGGVKSLYDKRRKWEILRTEKFEGGEILQFSAPGLAWEDPEIVTMQDFEKTSDHAFPFKNFVRGAIRSSAVREARFRHFTLRERFHLYHHLDRIDFEVGLLNWDGTKEKELRVAFPINLMDSRASYEVPFGTVEIGKDELDFTLLPPEVGFRPDIYGGDHPLPYREAINWIDVSTRRYLGCGCLAGSDSTVHLFRDQTAAPVAYPILQHVLLSTRKSLGWNPDYWFTQSGNHHYRMTLMPHDGNWRHRYREALGFNYPLRAFVGLTSGAAARRGSSSSETFLDLRPPNLVLTAMKKAEGNGNRIVIRFYEAEGNECTATIRLPRPILKAWRASLVEYDEGPLQSSTDGSVSFAVKPWEIVTIKVAVEERQ